MPETAIKSLVKIVDRIADDDLELARLGESALGGFQSASILATSALAGSLRTNRIRDTQWDTAAMFSLPPTYSSSSHAVLFVFTHSIFLLLPGRAGIP